MRAGTRIRSFAEKRRKAVCRSNKQYALDIATFVSRHGLYKPVQLPDFKSILFLFFFFPRSSGLFVLLLPPTDSPSGCIAATEFSRIDNSIASTTTLPCPSPRRWFRRMFLNHLDDVVFFLDHDGFRGRIGELFFDDDGVWFGRWRAT